MMAAGALLAATFVLSLFLTGVLRRYALKIGMLDRPNRRSSHSVPVPRGGGLAVVVAFGAGLAIAAASGDIDPALLAPLLLPLLLVAAIGWLDDHSPISARLRLPVHLLAAGLALVLLPGLPVLPLFHLQLPLTAWSYPLVLITMVWLVNLNNFMDGIDGIASVEAVSVTAGAAAILWLNGEAFPQLLPLLLLAAAAAGFLVWNRPPARIFMGDACSGFLGLAIGLFALITSLQGGVNLWTWLILYGVFVADATCTLLRRLVRGEKLHEPHRSHAYQILARRWRSHGKVTGLVLAVNICWLFPLAVVSSRHPQWSLPCAALALAPILVGVVCVGAGTREDEGNG